MRAAVTSREAVSLGLIVTELILNALKHAFTDDRTDRQIAVGFDVAGTNWKLSVADNGIGAPVGVFAQPKSGLGTSIINALAQQLDARVDVVSGPQGTSVSVTHATFAKMPDEPGTSGRRQFSGMPDDGGRTVGLLLKPGAGR